MTEDHSPGYSDAKKPKSICHPGTLEGPKYEVEWKASSGCLGSPALRREKESSRSGRGAGIQRVSSEVRQAPHRGWVERAGLEGSPGLERSSGDEGWVGVGGLGGPWAPFSPRVPLLPLFVLGS